MSALAPAFADPAVASQQVFRAVMDALARPGTVLPIAPGLTAPAPLSRGAAAIALALLDYETPVWLDAPLQAAPDVWPWLRFHTGAPRAERPDEAAFAFIADPQRAPAFDDFARGTPDYPDRSTTLVMQVADFAGPVPLALAGPGISGSRLFAAQPLPSDIAVRLIANRAVFPRGVDLLLATDDAVAGLPRSIRVSQGE